VVDRKDVGSWLEGPRSRTVGEGEWPGQRLGLPAHGPGSIAHFGVRLVGILIDWVIALVIARGLFGVPLPFSEQPATGAENFIVLAVLAVMNVLLVGTIGTTIGHRIMGLQVRHVSGGRATLPQAFIRTVLLCLAVPAIVWDRDGRGLHDKVPNTVIVRSR
jgi:uncharacterized RDD family membrane protein YckC